MPEMDEEAIFHLARRIGEPEARRLYLDQACGAAAPLRARVEACSRSSIRSPATSRSGTKG